MNSALLTKDLVLDYAAQGQPDGVPILFLHGLSDSLRSFDPIMARLPESLYAVAVSQRGHGDSHRPSDGYSPSDFAADLAALMDRLELQGAVIAGHSMGATVAQRFALTYPSRTRGLVLTGSFFKLKDHPAVSEFWESVVSKLEDPIDPAIVRSFQMSCVAKSVPDSFLETIVRESLKVPARVWKSTLRAFMETDFTHELKKIQAPTMLLWGDRDAFVSRSDQDRLLDEIPTSILNIYPSSGHAPHWEVPGQYAAEIADFVLH